MCVLWERERERDDCDVGSGVLGGIYGGRKVKKSSRWGLGQRSVWATLPFWPFVVRYNIVTVNFFFICLALGYSVSNGRNMKQERF